MFQCRRSYRHPKDGPWAWLVLFASTLSSAIFMGFVISFGILLPTLIGHFKSSIQKAAWVASLGLSLTTLIGPITSTLVNRFGCRAVAIFGCLLCTLALILTSFAESIEFMYFSYGFLFGCGSSFMNLPAILIIPEYFDKWRTFAVGVSTGGQTAGTIFYGPCLELLLSSFGWRWTFRVCAAMIFACLFLVFVYDPIENKKVDNEAENKNKNRRKLFHCSVWRSQRFILLTLAMCIGFFARYIPTVHLAQYCKKVDISDEDTGKLYLFIGVTATLSRPAAGLLCQIKGVRSWLVLEFSGILTAITFFVLPYLTTYGLMVIFAVSYGLIDGLFTASTNIMALNCFENPEKRASAFGIIMMCASLFLGSAPPLAGVLVDSYHSYNPVFYMAAAFCCLAAVITLIIPCTRKDTSQLLNKNDVEGENELLPPVTERESSI